MLRQAANLLLALMVVATQMWGGCVSCEQFFMFPVAHRSCCNEAGKCQRPAKQNPKSAKQDCNLLAFAPSAAKQLAAPSISVWKMAITHRDVVHASIRVAPRTTDIEVDPSPPDLQALYGTFLI